ncbi:MAG: GAF domain-containing protein [Terriglobia bacterium]
MNYEELGKYARYNWVLAFLHWIGLGLVVLFVFFPEFETYVFLTSLYVVGGVVYTILFHHILPARIFGQNKLRITSYLDIISIGVLMVLAGGHRSPFFFYFLLVVVGSALIFGRRRVLVETVVISSLLLAIMGWDLAFRADVAQDWPVHTVHFTISLLSLWLVSFFSAGLATIVDKVLQGEKAMTRRNKELYERESLARRELVAIQKTSAALLSNRDLDQVLEDITEGLTRGVGYDRAAIFLINKTANTIEGRYASGLSPELTRDTKVPLLGGRGMLFESIWQAKPLIVKSLFDDLNLISRVKSLPQEFAPKLAVVPIVSRVEQGDCAGHEQCDNEVCPLYLPAPDKPTFETISQSKIEEERAPEKTEQALQCRWFKVYGAIVVDNFKSKKAITEDNLAGLLIFAQNAAIAIENATFYREKGSSAQKI